MTDDYLSHQEIQELLGAYALDAVDQQERDIIEVHLQTCETCRAEMDDHRRLAQTLRRHATRVSPLASTQTNGNHLTDAVAAPAGARPGWAGPLALAIVVILLAAVFIQAQVRFDHLNATANRSELIERALLVTAGPEAVITELHTPRSGPALTVISLAGGGTGYAFNSTLPTLGPNRSYQLWSTANGIVTANVSLGRRPDIALFSLPSGVTEFLVTVEHNPIPLGPTLPAIAVGDKSPSPKRTH